MRQTYNWRTLPAPVMRVLARTAAQRARQRRPPALGDNAAMRRFSLIFALLGLLAACSPALNWRSISLADAPLSRVLPCKPDYAVRDVDWGAGKQQLSMAGCQADGATWAVSHVLLAQPQEAPAVLTRWQQALQNQLQLPPDTPAGVVFLLKGALELPQAVQVQWQGRDAQGAPVVADARWWARLEGTGVRVYQAIVLSPRQPVAVAARDTFVQGLQLR